MFWHNRILLLLLGKLTLVRVRDLFFFRSSRGYFVFFCTKFLDVWCNFYRRWVAKFTGKDLVYGWKFMIFILRITRTFIVNDPILS